MKFFKPIVSLLNKLKYSSKFFIIGVLLIIPLIVVSVLYMFTLREELHQADKRLEGIEYNILLKDLLQFTQQSRGLTISSLTDSSVEGQLDEKIDMVNATYNKLADLESDMKYDINTNAQLQAIQSKWNKLYQANLTDSESILSQYKDLNRDILKLMTDVSNNSELLLAQSQESFNLIYNATIELPSLAEHFGQMRALGVELINEDTFESNLDEFNSIYYLMQATINDLQASSEYMFKNEQFANQLQGSLNAVRESTQQYFAAIEKMSEGAISSSDYYDIATDSINTNFDFFIASLDILQQQLNEQYNELSTKTTTVMSVLIVIVILALLLFFGLYAAIRQSIRLLSEGTSQVAEGNLNVVIDLKTNDEMHMVETSFNSMTEKLNELVREITISSEHVASSSQQLNASSEEATASVEQVTTAVSQMAKDTNVQVISIKGSTQAMNEMVSGIERIAENSVLISDLTNETTSYANDGHTTVEKALQQMETIERTVELSSRKINELSKKSAEIDSIVNVKTEIADQTNLLSLNAAIEAARAGDHGRGFAVVAEEVRKLAVQSRESAAQIANLIKSIQTETNDSVKMMGAVTDNVKIGIQVTEESAYKFGHILTKMQELNPQMEDISATATEFSVQAEQVASTMQQLQSIAENTSSATEQIASTSEEQLTIMEEVSSSAHSLAEMAESLQSLVSQFKV